MGSPQTGQVGGGLNSDQFSVAAQNPLIAPIDLSQATIAGQQGGGFDWSKLPALIAQTSKLTGGGQSQGSSKGGPRGMQDIGSGLQALSTLASLYQMFGSSSS